MNYSVVVETISPDIEEEVSVVIDGQRLTCFASCLPYPIESGKTYQAELLPMVFNDYSVQESYSESPEILRVDESYSYIFFGKLTDGYLDCGKIIIYDEYLLTEFAFLNGKMVSWEVDRLDILFI